MKSFSQVVGVPVNKNLSRGEEQKIWVTVPPDENVTFAASYEQSLQYIRRILGALINILLVR